MDEPAQVFGTPFSTKQSDRLSWREYVRPYANPALSTCLTEGLLRLDGLRLAATWIDVVAMRIVEWAVATRQTVVLLSPDPYDLLVPLTAAAVHVRRMLDLKKQVGGFPPTDARVGIVTRRLQLRSAYRRLRLGGAKLFDAVPAATRLPTGGIAVLGRNSDRGWGTLFVERAEDLRGVKGLTLVVVDLPVYDWDQLDSINVPKIVVGHDPSDRLVNRLAKTTPVFAWDSKDLRGLQQVRVADGGALAPVAERLERLAAGTTCSPVEVPSQGVCLNAALFWSDIGPLHRAARGSYMARELTSEAHELFQDLLHLAVPTAFYEEQTGETFRARLRDLKHDEFQARGDLHELYLPTVHVELQDLAAALGARSPKTTALMTVLREAANQRRNVMLVARTAKLARVHRAYLETVPDLKRVRVTSLSEVAEETPADIAVLTGLAPAWARHVYASGIASEIRVLAYVPEGDLIVSEPFVEAEHVRRIVAYQQAYAAWLARPGLKARCWKALSREDIGVRDDDSAAPHVDRTDLSAPSQPDAPDVPPGLWDIDIRPVERPPAWQEQDVATPVDRVASVEGLRVTFDDGRWVILDRLGTVTRFNRSIQKAEPGTDVVRLSVGDSVVFLDGDSRKDVLAKVLEVAKEIPHLATAATWVEYWRDALRRAKQRFRTYGAFTDQLRARGCQREAQTVRLWVVGVTIGPLDPLDVQRVGDALGDAPLRDHHDTVYRGIDAFRGAHAQLMERVGALALQVGPAASAGVIDADEMIDERSGLTASDFQGCVEILQVASLSAVGPVPSLVIGRLREASDIEVDR
jgi:hypothetical protein